jgi:hypothetical protein
MEEIEYSYTFSKRKTVDMGLIKGKFLPYLTNLDHEN